MNPRHVKTAGLAAALIALLVAGVTITFAADGTTGSAFGGMMRGSIHDGFGIGSTAPSMMSRVDQGAVTGAWTTMPMYSTQAMPMTGLLAAAPNSKMLTIQRAQQRVQLYIKQFANPHLVIDEILEFQRNFYAIVKDTSTGHGAFEVLVNKWSGLVFPEYGPDMMWNTKYGMMRGGSGMMGYGHSRGPMTMSSKKAASIARQWLSRHRPGMKIETPDQFPGYYTVHFLKKAKIAGMLSVNGYSGQVWYHNWHGTFIRMVTVAG